MATQHNVLVLVGSLRRDSVTRKVARAMIALAPPSLAFQEFDLGPVPMYNEDLEADVPPSWTGLRAAVKAADAVLFFTPEYNRSVPAVIKNAIDVASRPARQGVWSGKPGAVVSVTPFALGAFGANHHLRQALVYVNVLAMAQPEAYISNALTLFDAEGNLTNEKSREIFTTFMTAFEKWIATIG